MLGVKAMTLGHPLLLLLLMDLKCPGVDMGALMFLEVVVVVVVEAEVDDAAVGVGFEGLSSSLSLIVMTSGTVPAFR